MVINVLVGRIVLVLQGSLVLVRGRLAIGLRMSHQYYEYYFGQSGLNILIPEYTMLAMINLFKSLNSEYNLIKTFASEYPYLTPINLFKTRLSFSKPTHKKKVYYTI